MTITVTVMSKAERADAISALMRHVESTRRSALSGLLYCTPEALDLFASGFVYEAFKKVREYAREGHVSLKNGYDVDHFLFQVIEGMPSEYRLASDDL